MSHGRRLLATLSAGTVCTVPILTAIPSDVANAATLPQTVPMGRTFLVNTTAGDGGLATARQVIAAAGGSVVTSWPQIGVTVGVAPADKVEQVVKRVRGAKGVTSAGTTGEISKEVPRAATGKVERTGPAEKPGDIIVAAKADKVRSLATGKGVTIAVADTGIFDEHSELAGRVDLEHSGSCTNGGVYRAGHGAWRPGKDEKDSHGTEVAGVAAGAIDGVGVQGIAPQARVVAMRVVSDDGNIYPEASICAAMQAAKFHLPVANHSYGLDHVVPLHHTFWDPAEADQAATITAVNKAFAWSRSHGVLNIVAMGNGGEDISDKPGIQLPAYEESRGPLLARTKALLAEVPGVVGVSESNPDGTVTGMSTVGLGITDLSSVGAQLLASAPEQYTHDAGTSFAAPAVTGTAALVKELRPKATPAQVERILEDSAVPTTCATSGEPIEGQPCRTGKNGLTNYFGHGRLDTQEALAQAQAQHTSARHLS